VAALVATAALAPAGCSRDEGRIALGSCGPSAEGPGHPERCGTFQVPLDWAHPGGEQMTLRVLVVPAQGSAPAPDPLVYLAGFGGSAIENAQWPYDHLQTVGRDHDLVFVEQRGTGSGAETCDLPQPGAAADDATFRDAVAACLAHLKRDPRHDTTTSAVADLDRARQRLGYDTIDLYGGSYGVSMGLAYLQAHPEHVRTAVLESGSLLDVRLWQLVPVAAQHAFDELVARCAADARCGPAYDPARDLRTLVDRLATAPVTVDLDAGRTTTIDVGGFLSGVIDGYLSRPETAVLLPGDLAAFVRGEWAAVLTKRGLVPQDRPSSTSAPVQAQQLTLRCSDEWAQIDAAAVAAQASSSFSAMTAADADWQRRLCALWPHDEGVAGPVRTDVPVLFVNGTADPADPPSNVATAAATMPNATFLTVPGGGHGVIDGCLIPLVEQFVQTATAPTTAAWQQCLGTMTAPAVPAA
jgi:pimeloyl-ACP methyl ester carboxylesterase